MLSVSEKIETLKVRKFHIGPGNFQFSVQSIYAPINGMKDSLITSVLVWVCDNALITMLEQWQSAVATSVTSCMYQWKRGMGGMKH